MSLCRKCEPGFSLHIVKCPVCAWSLYYTSEGCNSYRSVIIVFTVSIMFSFLIFVRWGGCLCLPHIVSVDANNGFFVSVNTFLVKKEKLLNSQCCCIVSSQEDRNLFKLSSWSLCKIAFDMLHRAASCNHSPLNWVRTDISGWLRVIILFLLLNGAKTKIFIYFPKVNRVSVPCHRHNNYYS